MYHPDMLGRYMDLDLTYLPRGSALALLERVAGAIHDEQAGARRVDVRAQHRRPEVEPRRLHRLPERARQARGLRVRVVGVDDRLYLRRAAQHRDRRDVHERGRDARDASQLSRLRLHLDVPGARRQPVRDHRGHARRGHDAGRARARRIRCSCKTLEKRAARHGGLGRRRSRCSTRSRATRARISTRCSCTPRSSTTSRSGAATSCTPKPPSTQAPQALGSATSASMQRTLPPP